MNSSTAIAIIGMAGRFPGARNITEFWKNLKNGVESIRPFTDAELLAAGVPKEELSQPEYVKSGAILEDMDLFDAAFFGFSPKDAAIMDPQQRVFLECAWEALEHAGHGPGTFAGSVGVYAGSGMNSYLIHNLLTNPSLLASAGLFLIRQTGNDKDVLATRVSYELDLRGPSISVQTACSTSLVAVHLACQSLLNQECDMALAGGVTIEFPHGRGYLYREGEILSRDGHCRAFDANSSGTVFSSGAGIVVLRRLEDSLADGDTIHAVILGSAINNDGARKAGYLAPSVEGQADVITEALGVAGVHPADIAYVETHGTGTRVGDPIEIKALTKAFRQDAQLPGSCAVGSLKTNIGHLDTAAGVAGLIKTVLALKNRQIPPSLHFHEPNPLIDFASSPFFVNTKLAEWKPVGGRRLAGVTSLGIGGTNAHVVLEEALLPAVEREVRKRRCQLLVLSAKTASALELLTQSWVDYFDENPELRLEDVAFTSQDGRTALPYRRAIAAADLSEASRLLREHSSSRVVTGQAAAKAPEVVFMFSGQGSQYANMGRELYETEPIFREQIDFCARHLEPDLGLDLRTLLYPQADEFAVVTERLSDTRFTQPALFSLEYALAQWWISHGVSPAAMIGHSIGEYVAACLAGVFSLEDGLHVCAIRGRLMSEMPRGSMLAVSAGANELTIPRELSLAAANGPSACVLSGPSDMIQGYASELQKQGVSHRELHTSHAFHSQMMDPMLASFHAEVAKVLLRPPKLKYISNLSGTWITAAEATNPDYWVDHLRHTVQFSTGLAELFREPSRVYLEVGPGQALTSLARQNSQRPKASRVQSSMRHPQEQVPATSFLLTTAARLWIQGCWIDWPVFHHDEKRRRVPLPTYPFERRRFWIEPKGNLAAATSTTPKPNIAKTQSTFQHRVWKHSPLERTSRLEPASWLIFLDDLGLGTEICTQLEGAGHTVLRVSAGSNYRRTRPRAYVIRPGERRDYDQLLDDILKSDQRPTNVLHLWALMSSRTSVSTNQTLDLSFYSLLFLAQALGDTDLPVTEISCLSNGLHSVAGEPAFQPVRAALLGPIRTIPKEILRLHCRSIDLDWELGNLRQAASNVIEECSMPITRTCVAWRNSARYVEEFEAADLMPHPQNSRLKEQGVYWITGGLGGVGLVVAEYLARKVHARLVLSARTPVPPSSEWNRILVQPEKEPGLHGKIRKLRELESFGSEVLTLAVDVTDSRKMAEALRTIQRRFGPLNGVIHAAGFIEDGPLQLKSRDSVARVLAPKIHGTLVLEEVLLPCKLDFYLLFSSVSSFNPPAGQVDYAGANAFLDAFALSHPAQRASALNWSLWTDIGMGSRATGHPVLGRSLVRSSAEISYASRLSCKKDWLLSDHRTKAGEALIPGTAYMQLASAALLRDRFERGILCEDVFFLAPLFMAAEQTKEVRVRLLRQGAAFRFSILAKDGGQDWIQYASGQISRNQEPMPPRQSLDAIRRRCAKRGLSFDDEQRTRQERYFEFGPRWRNLQSIGLGNNEALAELRLKDEFAADLPTWFLHPALLDLATGSSLYLINGYEESDYLYLPLSYKAIRCYRPLTAHIYSHIRCQQANSTQREVATFDLTLLDADGQVLAEINEFSVRRIKADAEHSLSTQLPRPATAPAGIDEPDPDSGISSTDAIAALEQVLASDMAPNIVIARENLRLKPAEPPDRASVTQAPLANNTDVQAILAHWWEELLGIERVSLDDDFFDLGGHSLIAVRLFSKIKKEFNIDLGLSTLFQARTVRKLASLIDQRAASNIRKENETPAVVSIRGHGSRLPLFVISGLGGEVIGFDTLARALGEDQPVFALQPQGLDGRKPFLTRIEDMADYHLREIRKAQAHGPYCLAGYSFGGYIAFQIAQQLYAAGETVALLGFLDTIQWDYLERVGHFASFRQRWAVRLGRFKKGGWAYVRMSAGYKSTQMMYRLFHRMGSEVPPKLANLQDINRFAMSLYKPAVYPGRLTIFRSLSREAWFENDELLGWGGLAAGGIEVQDVTGRHLDMLKEPNVRILAAKLRACLDRAQIPLESENPDHAANVTEEIVGQPL